MSEPVVPKLPISPAAQPPVAADGANAPERVRAAELARRAGGQVLDAAWRMRQMGPRRGATLVLALAASLAAILVVWPMREQARELQQQLVKVSAERRDLAVRPDPSGRSGLSRVEQLPAIVGELLTRAQAAGLELSAGSYRLVPGKSGGLSRYEIALPLTGAYPSIRQFVEASLVSVPTLALESLSLKRPDVAAPKVEVEVQFVVFVAEDA